jgi:cobalt/nickel transport protein
MEECAMKKLIPGFCVLILLTPLGLLAPGTAWGEWGLAEIHHMKGFIPQGMNCFLQSAIGYIFSALVGVALIALFFWFFAQFCKPTATAKQHDPLSR